MPVFLEDLVGPFYEPVGPNYRQAYVRGQIFFIHIGYTHENLELWRPRTQDASGTTVTAFELVNAGGGAFARAAPLYSPRLETNEEFIAVRAKRRPVILMAATPPDPRAPTVRGGGRVYRRLAIVVPVYSLVNRLTREFKYHPDFIENLRMLAYPEFLYLPTAGGPLWFPSYARVGELQAVYQPHLDPRDSKLRQDVLGILQDQVFYLVTGQYGGLFEAYREQLLNQM